MILNRYYQNLEELLNPRKALIIYGPRQVGKTTLVQKLIKNTNLKTLSINGENLPIANLLNSQDFSKIKDFIGDNQLLVIDEAQKISQIGQIIKIIIDNFNCQVVATGSSSFDLANQIGEPLVGRKKVLKLFPLSYLELQNNFSKYDLKNDLLENFLIYGAYPESVILETKAQKEEFLIDLTSSYLFKDILSFDTIKYSKTLLNLTKLLAFQIGSQVSCNELANKLNVDVKTVIKYLDLLEKSFIITPLTPFSRNLRSEINQKNKYYFYDLGIRNAVINQLQDLSNRADAGALWENFLFMERLKKNSYLALYQKQYFWRTYSGQEIDLIEEKNNKINAFEFKWGKKIPKIPKIFQKNYEANYEVINRDNFWEFVN